MSGRRHPLAWLPLLCWGVVAASGCASLRLPRIDPSGERFLICPKDEIRTPVPVAANPSAPPVLTDPFFPPQPALSPGVLPSGVQTATNLTALMPQDKLTITPDRILAPVGSEVILKSGVCTAEGFLLADQKIEWQLARDGVGQFVDLGGKGWLHPPLLPWNKGSKVDNYYAIGYTANGPMCITRGNADPADDVEIRRGDAWASVNSPVEGTSRITAWAPSTVENWDHRSATATIYWVDVQWTFPPATISSSGRPETLTTVVTRQTDGTPLEGWIVRYETGEAAQLGASASGQTLEVRTGPDGKASVEISPTDSGAPTTLIQMQLVRPANFGQGDAPRLVVANGASTIQWRGDVAPYLSPGQPMTAAPGALGPGPTWQGQETGPPRVTPQPVGPPPSSQPPVGEPAAPLPQLDVEVRGADTVEVGEYADFEIVIRNVGPGTATEISVRSDFPEQFVHDADPNRELSIENTAVGSLGPGQVKSVPLRLLVKDAGSGNLSFDVTVRCRETGETAAVSERMSVRAIQAAPQKTAALKVEKVGPLIATENEKVMFTITVTNTGELPLSKVEIRDEYPSNFLEAIPRITRADRQAGGQIVWQIPRLDVGKQEQFIVDVKCLEPSISKIPSFVTVKGTYEMGNSAEVLVTSDDHEIEIRPSLGGPLPAGPAQGTGGNNTSPLRVLMTVNASQIKRGSFGMCEFDLENTTSVHDEQVEMLVAFPPGIVPNLNAIEAPNLVRPTPTADGVIKFSPLATLRRGESEKFKIPISATQSGAYEIHVYTRSKNSPGELKHVLSLNVPD